MSGFVPVNDDHAVDTVIFHFQLSHPISQNGIATLQANHSQWKAELPAIQALPGPIVNLNGVALPSASGGLAFSQFRPDGTPAWELRFDGNIVGVTCSRYTRWDRIWEMASSLFSRSFLVLSGVEDAAPLMVQAAILNVMDGFTAAEQDADFDTLFDVNYSLHPMIKRVGKRWHQNLGWFESAPAGNEVLHHLNMSAGLVPSPSGSDGTDVRVQIGHYQEYRFTERPALSELANEEAKFAKWFAEMHSANKAAINRLITSEMSSRIGLTQIQESGVA